MSANFIKIFVAIATILFSVNPLVAQSNEEKVEFYAILGSISMRGIGKSVSDACGDFLDRHPVYLKVADYDQAPILDAENRQIGISFNCYMIPLHGPTYAIDGAMRCGEFNHDPSDSERHFCQSSVNPAPVCTDDKLKASLSGAVDSTAESVGNPISLLSGKKVELVKDWSSSIDPRFAIERLHTGLAIGKNNAALSFGDGWGSLFDQRILRRDGKSTLYRFDGSVYYFARKYQSGWVEGATGPNHTDFLDPALLDYDLEVMSQAEANRNVLTDGQGREELYAATPGSNNVSEWSYLEEVRWPDGYVVSFERDASFVVTAIEDNRGQRAEITTDASLILGQDFAVVTTVEVDTSYDDVTFSPKLRIEYEYQTLADLHPSNGDGLFVGRLFNTSVEVVDPNSNNQVLMRKVFGYSLQGNLVTIEDGRVDANGNTYPYASFGYSNERAALSSHFGGVDQYQVSALTKNGTSLEATVTNPLGKQTVYTYDGTEGRRRLVAVEGVASTNCLPSNSTITRDSQERIAELVNRNGSRTAYTRDAEGRVLSKVEDADGIAPRVTTYTWQAGDFRKPASRTTAELKEYFTYDSDGLLLSYTQEDVLPGSPDLGKLRTWTYSYTTLPTGFKVMASVDGPGLAVDGVNDVTVYEYDTNGRVTKVTDPNGLVQEVLAFGSTGQPTLIKDHKSFEWELEYDALGRLIKSTFEPNGVDDETTYQYDIIGQMTSSTDALNRTTTYVYDEARRLVQIAAPSGDTIEYTHDAMGNVTQTSFSNQSAVVQYFEQTQYDELGRILQAIGSNGQSMAFSHDVEDNLVSETDALGLQATRSYDALNRLTDLVDRASFTTTMEHDEDDQMTRYVDPRGIEITMAYNGFGELVAETSADRGLMTYTYNNRGLPVSYTDGRGEVTTYTYDDGGRLTAKRSASDTSLDQHFSYYQAGPIPERNGDLSMVSDQAGKGTHELTLGTATDARYVRISQSGQNLDLSEVRILGIPPAPPPTASVDLTAALSPVSVAASSLYNPGSYPASNLVDGITGGNNWASTLGGPDEWYELDLQNTYELTSVVVTARSSSGWRVNGSVVTLLDDTGQVVHTFAPITGAGDGTVHTLSVGGVANARFVKLSQSNQYYNVSEVQVFATSTNPISNASSGTPAITDLTNTLTGVTVSASSVSDPAHPAENLIDGIADAGNWTGTNVSANEWFEIDLQSTQALTSVVVTARAGAGANLDGAVVSLLDGSGQVVHSFAPITGAGNATIYTPSSDRGQLEMIQHSIEGASYGHTYDLTAEGQVTDITYPSQSRLIPTYNNDGELTRLQWEAWDPVAGLLQSPVDVLNNITYLPFGPMTGATYGDGATFAATYDSSYRLTGLTDIYAGSTLRDETYSWTTRDNLAGVTDNLDPTKTQSFTYSSREKLAGADGLWGEFDYAYDGVGNRVSFTETVGGTPNIDLYTYPATSNQLQDIVLASGGMRTLTYDAAGNVTYDNRNGQGYGYNYDAAGRMSSFAINGVIQAEYEYNYQGHQVIRRLTQLGQTIHNIFDADGQRIAEYLYDDSTGTSSLIREYLWANGALVGVSENDTLYFVRTDHIGRPVFATDDTGSLVWEASYLPFGGVVASTGPNSDLRFPGQWFQSESGLHQNWMRDYDPTLGRYIQADPLGLVDGASVYGYVRQNPVRYIDPTGLITHVTGRWIECGKNCRIRIDRSYVNGKWSRHLHWECRGDFGVCGEDGEASHGQTWEDAPQAVKDCAIKNGFNAHIVPMSKFADLAMILGLLGITAPQAGGAAAVAGGMSMAQ